MSLFAHAHGTLGPIARPEFKARPPFAEMVRRFAMTMGKKN